MNSRALKWVRDLICAALLSACTKSPAIERVAGPVIGGESSADPALAVDPRSGDVLMAWLEGDSAGYQLRIARSQDSGVTWSAPTTVAAGAGEVAPHAEASPRLVVSGAVVGLFWARSQAVPGRRFPASQIRFARSSDGGATWTAPRTLNDDSAGTPAGHTFHGATIKGDSMMVAWLDSREVVEDAHGSGMVHHEGSSRVFSAVSPDLGTTWEATNRRNWDGACPCCRVSLAAHQGRILVAWRGHFDNDVRDVVIGDLADRPAPPRRIHADDWSFPGCPHSGPGLSVRDDQAAITWFTGAPQRGGIYFKRLTDAAPTQIIGGENLPAAHPTVALLSDGAIVAANLNAAGRRILSVAHVHDGHVSLAEVPNTSGADHPQLVALSDHAALVAWTQKTGRRDRVHVARVATR